MAIQKVIDIVVNTGQAVKEIKDVFNTLVKAQKEADKLADSFDEVSESVEGVGKSGEKTKKGLKTVKTGLIGIGTAFKTAGIGLIVGVFALLTKAFTKNEKVAKALGLASEYVSSVISEIVDVVDDAVTSVANATNGFEALGNVISGVINVGLGALKFNFFNIKLAVQQVQLAWEQSIFGGKDADKIKELNKNIKETKNNINEVLVKTVQAGEQVVNNFGGAVNELGQLGGAVVDELSNVEIKSSVLRKRAEKEAKKTEEEQKQRAIRLKVIRDKQIEDEKNRLQKIADINNRFIKEKEDLDADNEQKKLDLLKERAEAELDLLIGTETEKEEALKNLKAVFKKKQEELDAENEEKQKVKDAEDEEKRKQKANKEIEIQQEVADAKKTIQDANIDNISKGISLVASLDKKNKVLQGASLIAENIVGTTKTTINTQAANSAATLKYAALPGGVGLAAAEIGANNISAGISIATSTLATAKALGSLGGGSAKGSTSSSGGGGQGSEPTAPAFNLVGGTGTNQIQDTLQQDATPIQAVVVSSAVTSAQEMDRNAIDGATLG